MIMWGRHWSVTYWRRPILSCSWRLSMVLMIIVLCSLLTHGRITKWWIMVSHFTFWSRLLLWWRAWLWSEENGRRWHRWLMKQACNVSLWRVRNQFDIKDVSWGRNFLIPRMRFVLFWWNILPWKEDMEFSTTTIFLFLIIFNTVIFFHFPSSCYVILRILLLMWKIKWEGGLILLFYLRI